MRNTRRGTQDFPPGYPSRYESVVRLADGRRVQVRPILPSDAPELAEAIRTADAETLHARFLGGPPRRCCVGRSSLGATDCAGDQLELSFVRSGWLSVSA